MNRHKTIAWIACLTLILGLGVLEGYYLDEIVSFLHRVF